MNEQTTQFLLESAESLREQRHKVIHDLAYTAPELITAQTRQWIATTESLIDLFDAAAASSEDGLREKAVVVAAALLADYSVPVALEDVRTKVLEAVTEIIDTQKPT